VAAGLRRGSRSPAEIVGSNPTEGMDFYCECCVLSGRGLCDRADHSSRGVLQNVECRCVWSRNLVSEKAPVHWGLLRPPPQIYTPQNRPSFCMNHFKIFRWQNRGTCWSLFYSCWQRRCLCGCNKRRLARRIELTQTVGVLAGTHWHYAGKIFRKHWPNGYRI